MEIQKLKQTVYLPVNGSSILSIIEEGRLLDNVEEQEGYFFTDLEIQDIFTIFARENNISQEKVKIFLNDNFK